jgi:hypothetical protein
MFCASIRVKWLVIIFAILEFGFHILLSDIVQVSTKMHSPQSKLMPNFMLPLQT